MHCNKGVSRSPSMVVAYLMKTKSMDVEQALSFVVERRAMVNPNESFRRQLQEYGRRLQRGVPKVKGACGPVGPARGPIGPSPPPTHDGKDESKAPPASIGPQLPPHLKKARTLEASGDDHDSSVQEVALKAPRAIGPSLPPHLKRPRAASDEDTQEKKRKKE